MMIPLATINVGETEDLRATLSYDQEAKRIYSEAPGLPTEELDVRPETIEQAEDDIQAMYAGQPVWSLQWIERDTEGK